MLFAAKGAGMESHALLLGLAGLLVRAQVCYVSTERYCADYLVDAASLPAGAPEPLHVSVTAADIDYERSVATAGAWTDEYLETLALLRKIAEAAPLHDAMLFHSSIVAVDGRAYVFCAPSGTGKSTHTRLWRELLGARATCLNDDKPFLRFGDAGVQACGSPWRGKHALGCNMQAPVTGVCVVAQAPQNAIRRLSTAESLKPLFAQAYRPADPAALQQTLAMVMRLQQSVPVWHLDCLPNLDAARVAFEAMTGESV